MRLLSMAFLNLARNKRRTMLAGISVAISIMLIVIMHGMIGGFLGSIVKNYTKNDTGHVNIVTTEYRSRERFSPVNAAIPDSGAVIAALKGSPGLEGARFAERSRFGVLLSSGPNTKAALGIAGDPETEKDLLMLDRSVMPGGRYIEGPGETILGEGLATDLGLGLGDDIKVITQRADYGLGFKKFKIVGIFRTRVNTLDAAVFQIGMADARELLALGPGAQQILVMLKDYRDSDRAALTIEQALSAQGLDELSVKSWTAMGDFPRFIRLAESMYFFIYLIVAFLGAFIITNIMMMVVLERRKEIGLLKSMGMPNKEVLTLFLAEGTIMGLLGSAVGALLGLVANIVMHYVGWDVSAAMAGFNWPMDNVVYFTVSIPATIGMFAIGCAVSATVALLPSRSAARMNPIDAIRSV
ncbi:ABC transporter permease [Spirochaetota bacterium]